MTAAAHRTQNPAEGLAVWTLQATWPFYFIGALYVVGPFLAWTLALLTIVSLYLGPAMRPDLRATWPLPPVVWGWIVGMFAMLIALWIGHIDWSLGLGPTVKSSIGWAKGWAMLALFPLVGAALPIRREPLIRAQCVVGLWTLCLAPLFFLAPSIGLPSQVFVSPLKAIGGPGPEYFTVYLYTIDPSTGAPRWQFYAPWSPFAGLLGVVMILFALEERDRRFLAVGVAAGLVMILLSKSRMSLVALFVCTVGPRIAPLLLTTWAWSAAAAVSVSFAAIGEQVVRRVQDGVDAFKNARADSTRVRETLQRIAEERWRSDALWFGHGMVQPGPHLVEYMPIGSHHTWYGLLFVKGLSGFLALLIPMIWQFALALKDCVLTRRGRLPLGVMLVFLILSFGENIEIEAYLLWPALLILGVHAREMRETPT